MNNTLKLDKVNPILINLTGVRLLVLFSFLLEAPRSAEEIYQHLEAYNYPRESISIDTIRNDMNSLRLAGCIISRADKSNNFKYKLLSHPFELHIDFKLAKSLNQLYQKGLETYTIQQLIYLDNMFKKIAKYTTDNEVAEYILGISLVKNIDKDVMLDLWQAWKRNQTITFTYNAPSSGQQEVTFVIKKFEFRSKKLYIDGYSVTHQTNTFLLVSKILAPITVHMKNEPVINHTMTVRYELINRAMNNYEPLSSETIIKQDKDSIIIELTSNNEFKITQRVFSYGANCRILAPSSYKEKIIKTLKAMKKVYENGQTNQ